MLFMGYMALVGAQFLKMLVTWGPDPDFPQGGSRADALFGGGGKPWEWPQRPKLAKPEPIALGHFVKSKGAAFFVVPPLRWLKAV